jgi:4'-phosphopantetheinyl transferase
MIDVYVSLEAVPFKEQRPHAHGLLAECLKAAGAEYVFGETPLTKGEHGKPSLVSRPDIHYNLSHANGVCACVADRDECGIDCETVRPYRPRVTQRVFSAEEQAVLAALPEGERDMYFFRIWTLKEAFVKAIGVGVSYPMKTVSFDLSGGAISANAGDWRFAQFIINETAVVSVCSKAVTEQKTERITTREEHLILRA